MKVYSEHLIGLKSPMREIYSLLFCFSNDIGIFEKVFSNISIIELVSV